MKRGEIYYAELGAGIGSEQNGNRPVVIIQNDIGNKYSPTIIVAPITTQRKRKLPTHVKLKNTKLEKNSSALLEQIRTVDKSRIKKYICLLGHYEMKKIDEALRISIQV